MNFLDSDLMVNAYANELVFVSANIVCADK